MTDKVYDSRPLLEGQDEDEKELDSMNRKSNEINGDTDDEQEEEKNDNNNLTEKPHLNLSQLPAGVPIDSVIGEEMFLVPNSTRKALIARWDGKKHNLNQHDKNELEKRNLLEKWEQTVAEISGDPKKQPMNNTPPFLYRVSWGMLRLVLLLLLIYIELVLCQIFLMNVVIIGLCIWFHLKTMVFSNGMIKNKMYSYRHREFKSFLAHEKSKYGLVELVPGKEGKWIEIKLEEDENDSVDQNINLDAYIPNEDKEFFEETKN